MITTACLIVGAGPTGLGAAWALAERGHTDWRLCEAADAPGGLASSVVDAHGFTWDLGGHVQFSHYERFDRLMDDLLGVDGWLYHERESWVRVGDRFVPYPFQLNLHRLADADREACVRGLVAASRRVAAGAAPPANFGEWIDLTFGDGIASAFMRPYNVKVWAHPPESMSARWVGDRVATVDLPRVVGNIRDGRDDVSWGPNNRFRFPRRGGTGAIWRALWQRLAARHGDRMHLERTLRGLDTGRHVATFSDGTEIRYERMLSTIALDQLVALSDLRTPLAAAARGLVYSSTHVIGVGLQGAPPPDLVGKCWMYFPGRECPFYRVTHFSHYSPANVPDATRWWSLMAEVSESAHKPVDAARVVDDTLDGLVATGLIPSRAPVCHAWHTRLERGYPVPSLGRDAALDALLPAFEARGVFSRGRFGAWKYEVSNQDHSVAQGVEVVEHWLDGAEEVTVHQPEIINARRPRPAAHGAGR